MTKGMLKSVVAIFVMAMVFTVSANAQGQGRGKGRSPEKMTQKLAKKLDLSDAQTQQLATMNQAFAQEMEGIRSQEGIERDEKRELAKAAKDRHQSQIRSILTAEQQAEFDELIAKREAKRAKRGGKKGKRGRGFRK